MAKSFFSGMLSLLGGGSGGGAGNGDERNNGNRNDGREGRKARDEEWVSL